MRILLKEPGGPTAAKQVLWALSQFTLYEAAHLFSELAGIHQKAAWIVCRKEFEFWLSQQTKMQVDSVAVTVSLDVAIVVQPL